MSKDVMSDALRSALRDRAVRDVEALRHENAEPGLEWDLSVKDWIDRMQAAAKEAYRQARLGNAMGQYAAFMDIGGIAVARMEQLLAIDSGVVEIPEVDSGQQEA